MHADRKFEILLFGLSCFTTGATAMPFIDKPWPMSPLIVFPILFLAVSLFIGHRMITRSDDWYRARDERQIQWIKRHPLLTLVAVIVGVLGLVWRIIDFFFFRSRP